MPRRIWFGDDYWDFSDDATKEEIDAVGMEWMRFGSIDAVRQKKAIEGLTANPDFLSLPRIERHAAFNQYAKDGPYWGMLKPEERRLVRESVVNKVEGANPAETYNYSRAPFSYAGNNILDKAQVFGDELGGLLGDAISTGADLGRALQVGGSDLAANLMSGATTRLELLLNEPEILTDPLKQKWDAKYGVSGEELARYTDPKMLSFEKAGEYTKDLEPRGDSWAARASGDLAEKARELAQLASEGRDLIAAPTKYGSFEEAREEGGIGGYIRHGLTTGVGQAPQVGLNIGLGMIPVVGPALSSEAMMSMETGGALDQMVQDGMEIGLGEKESAAVAGTINGILERVPIGALFNRIPGFKEPFKKAVLKHTWEVLKQGGLEGVTEFAQNIVTDASIDVANLRSGDLDKIRWSTPEGRAESIGQAWEAAQAGQFVGTVMGLFGLGAGQLQRRIQGAPPTGEQMAAEAQARAEARPVTSEMIQAARDIIMRRAGGDQGPAVPEMGGMPPIEETQPGVRPEEFVAPTGSAPPRNETLPLRVGPEGASLGPRGNWTEMEEQKARFNYRPPWLDPSPELVEAFTRGDMDEDVVDAMVALAMAQGIEPMEARADLLARRDQAWAFLRGDMVQPEQEPVAVRPEDMPDWTPSQEDRGAQRGFGEALGPGPAAPPPTRPSPQPVAPTQPHGVEAGPMRLGEDGQPIEMIEGQPPRAPQGPPDLLTERVDAAPVQPPLQAPQPQPAPPAPRERRERARGREIDQAASVVFDLGRKRGMNPELIGTLVDNIVKGDDPETTLRRPIFEGIVDDAMVTAVTDLGEAVFQRYVKTEADRRIEAEIDEMLGTTPEVTPESPPPELSPEEIDKLTRGAPAPAPPSIGKAMAGAAAAAKGKAPVAPVEAAAGAVPADVEGEVPPTTEVAPVSLTEKDVTPENIEGQFRVGKHVFDQEKGIGAVPDQTNVKYLGYTAFMTPGEFLRLNPSRNEPLHEETAKRILAGEPMASPWMSVEVNEETGEIKVFSHEGRGRAKILSQAAPNEPIPVNIFPRGGVRARHLKKEWITGQLQPDRRVTAAEVTPSRVIWRDEDIFVGEPAAEAVPAEPEGYPDLEKVPPAVGNFKAAIARAAGDQKELGRLDESINSWIKQRMRKGEKLSKDMKQAVKALKADLGKAREAQPAETTRGADVPIDEAKKANFDKRAKSRGETEAVITPDSAMEEEVEFVLIEAEHLTTSHQGRPLEVNPAYPETLQPRDRTRAASEEQVEDIKRKLDPGRLGSARVSNSGAPIVGADGVVESGNARTVAIKRAYDEKTEKAAAYKRWLVENAESFGLNKNVLMGMAQPVLVRVRKRGERRAEFAERSAAPEAQQMSPAEIARKDAGNVTTEMMGAFNPSEDGDVTAASNREFVRLFLDTLSGNERSDMIDAEGELSLDGIKRIENAVLAKAYGDAGGVVESLIESKDNQITRIGAAMLRSAPRVIDARDSMAQGVVDPALDLVEPLMEAVTMISRLRRQGMAIEKYLAQENLFGADMTKDGRVLLEHFSSKELRNSAKAMAEFIELYYSNASRETFNDKNPPLMDLGIEAATRETLIQMTIDGKGKDQSELFSLGEVDEKRTITAAAALRRALPGWTITKLRKGLYRLTRNGQPILHVMQRPHKEMTQKEYERTAAEYGMPVEELIAGIRSGELAIKGGYSFNDVTGAHLVSLYGRSDVGSVFHEAFHFVFHNILTAPQRKLLVKAFGSEEAAATAYEKYAKAPQKKLTAPQKIFEAIRNFAKRLLDGHQVDIEAAGKLMDRIAKGDIYEQSGRFYVETNPSGSIALKTTANAVLNAEEAAREISESKNLEEGQFHNVLGEHLAERPPDLEFRGDMEMFQMERSPDIPDRHHPGIVLPEMTKTEQRREWAKTIIYDKLAPILRVQEKLTGVGEMVDSAINAYMKAANFQSRAGALLDWAQSNLFEPLLEDIAASGIALHDFDLFRMSIHALERNLKLRQMHVTIPIQVAETKIRKLAKKKITRGAKVRDLKFGNRGKVKSVMEDRGKAEVEFVNPKNPFAKKRVTIDMAQLELESLARERDKIAEIRRMVDEGETPHSGMPDEHAKAVLEEMRSLGLVEWSGELGPTTTYRGRIAQLSKRFQDIVRWKEETLYKAGLLSKEELQKWRDYKYYTPMRGKDPDILDVIAGGKREALSQIEDYGGSMWNRAVHAMARAAGIEETIYTPSAGRGFNPGRRPAAHRALGRRSFPKHSPTAELITDAMQAAVRAERNRVAKTIWNLVNEIKDVKDVNREKLFEIDTPDSRLVFDEKTGTVKTKVDGLSVTKNNVYSIWIDGKLHYIRAVSPQMAEFISALNNIGQHKDIHPVLKGMGAINRYISRMATSLNPGFVFPNAERDAITAGIKLAGEAKFKDFGLKTMERAPEAWNLLATYSRHESAGTLDQMDSASRKRVERFKLAGGETAFWMIPDIELQMKRLQKALKRAKGDQKAIVTGIRSVTDFLEDYNGAVEGMMRFSVFERALDMGMTEDQAATLARDITVDFTKQGTIAQTLGGLWVFANASIQGSMNMLKAVAKNKPLQRIVVGAFVFSFMHATMQRALGGKDEEDDIYYWDKIPWYEKSRNLIVMNPFEKGAYFKFPMPWGYNLFTAAGTATADVVGGRTTVKEAGANVLSTFLSAFNPIGDNDLTTLSGFFQMIMPSPLDPIFDIALNRTFWGGPIKPEETKYKKSEQYGERQPKYNRYFNSVSKASKWATRNLYKYFGVDVSPEDVDYGIAAAFGGLGDTINRGVSTIAKGLAGEPVSPREMPIIKSFYGEESEFFAPQMYRENMADYWLKKETFNELKKTNPKMASDFYKRHKEVLGQEPIVKLTEKRIRELKDAGVKISDARMQREMKQFNRRFNTVHRNKVKRRIVERN